MRYNIKLTDEFLNEFEEICNYISINLKAKVASNRLREKAIYNILLLEESPRIFAKIEKMDKLKREYRRITINNYIILYTIDEIKKIIYVSHIYYGGKNYLEDLI